MPLRDHFRPPLDNIRHWEGFHAGWPTMIVAGLRPKLPRSYFAGPRIRTGGSVETDMATFGQEVEEMLPPPRPTFVVSADLPALNSYEVRFYDETCQGRLVAVIEIISPVNKDRAEHRRAFAAKCCGLLQERVSVVLVDIVTTCSQNLYQDLLALIGNTDSSSNPAPPLYAASCRMTKRDNEWFLETWVEPLDLGRPLPTMPLWLADNLAIPLELEQSYEQSCNILGIP